LDERVGDGYDAAAVSWLSGWWSIQDRYGNTLTVKRDLSSAGKRILSITSPNKRTLNFLYDTGNRITQIQDDLGRIVSYDYDANGRLWHVTDPAGGTTEYTYEDTTNHRMRTIKGPRGIVYLTNEYDALSGRITRQTLADPTATYQFSYTTDSGGHVTQTDVTDPRGFLRRVTFNANGYTASDTGAVGQPEAQTTTLAWDLTTNLLQSVTDPLGRLTTYTYDSRGNVQTITRLADRPADAAAERLGPERPGGLRVAFAARDEYDHCRQLGLPRGRPNPFHGLHAAVTRRPLTGDHSDWQRGQLMTRLEAVRSFTSWNAWAAGQEAELGSLEIGKRADLVVVDDDVFTCEETYIKGVVPALTMVGGEVVFARDDDGGKAT
jgi:YD repeat-containing protein